MLVACHSVRPTKEFFWGTYFMIGQRQRDDLKSIPFEVGSPFVSMQFMGVLTSVPIVMYWKICDLDSQYFPVAFRILALILVSS